MEFVNFCTHGLLHFRKTLRLSVGIHCEAHFPTQRPQAGQEAWLPASHVDPLGASHHQVPAQQGTGTTVGLIGSIRNRGTFQRFRSEAIRARHDWLQIAALPPAQPGALRVAFALNRRIGSAVQRNRLRRQVRHVLADLARHGSPLLPPGEYLVMVHSDVGDFSHDELVDVVDGALAKLEARR
jgi:ribonuclease P protein component